MNKPWTKSEMTELIRLYKLHPELYDTNHEHYYNRTRRDLALKFILDKIDMPGLTIEALKAKIRQMRAQYLSEKIKIDSKKNAGEPERKPTLWSYPLLTFLDGYMRKSDDVVKKRRIDEMPEKMLSQTSHDRDYTREIEKAAIESLEKINNFMAEQIKENCFGNFVNEELEEISDRRIRTDVKWKIQVILKKALEKDRIKEVERQQQLLQQQQNEQEEQMQQNHENQIINVLSGGEGITYLQTIPTSNGLTQFILAEAQQMEVTGNDTGPDVDVGDANDNLALAVTNATAVAVATGGGGGGVGDPDEEAGSPSMGSPTKSYDTDDISEPDLVEESLRRLCNSEEEAI